MNVSAINGEAAREHAAAHEPSIEVTQESDLEDAAACAIPSQAAHTGVRELEEDVRAWEKALEEAFLCRKDCSGR